MVEYLVYIHCVNVFFFIDFLKGIIRNLIWLQYKTWIFYSLKFKYFFLYKVYWIYSYMKIE